MSLDHVPHTEEERQHHHGKEPRELRMQAMRSLIARSEQETRRAKQLRYRVFVHEKGWEAPQSDDVDEESDIYDDHAEHGLLFDAVAGRDIGAVRIILTSPDRPGLPMQRICSAPQFDDAEMMRRSCEVSRLCILKDYRSAGGLVSINTECGLLLRLVSTIAEIALENGRTRLFALMEPRLIQKLALCGIDFEPIGEAVEHRGMRHPTMLKDIGETLEHMRNHHRAAWEIVSDAGRLELMARRLKLSPRAESA
mgnify:CR=1 FL=1